MIMFGLLKKNFFLAKFVKKLFYFDFVSKALARHLKTISAPWPGQFGIPEKKYPNEKAHRRERIHANLTDNKSFFNTPPVAVPDTVSMKWTDHA
jgi:hypothetical protein